MPPALAIPSEASTLPWQDENSRVETKNSPSTQRLDKSAMPPRIIKKKKKKQSHVVPVEETDNVSSPETPEHYKSVVSREDLAFADFTSLGAYFDPPRSVESSDRKVVQDRFCLPAQGLFRRKKRISSVDVASVGNGSDTMVSVGSRAQMSGRELHERAKMYFNDGDYKRACPLFEAILSAQVRRFSPVHPSVGAAMHNVGVCRLRMGQHSLAENLFSEAVLIRRQVLGEDNLEVASSLAKLGMTRVAMLKFDEAHEDLQVALRITMSAMGHGHKLVALMLGHLGCFYFESGELYAAQASFEEALGIYRHVWPREPDRDSIMALLTDTLCNIGSIFNRRKKYSKAVEAFSEALDLQRGIYGHDDSHVIAALDNLGYAYSKMKNHASALSCYRKMLRAQISLSGTFSDEAFQSLRKQLLMYEKMNRIPEAVDETKEIIQLQKSMLHADDPIIGQTKLLLATLKKKMPHADSYS